MSEDEAIKTLNDYLRKTHSQFCKVGAVGIPNIEYFALEKLLDLYQQEKEKNKKLELQLKNSDIERLRDYIKYKIECFENIMNGRLGDGARPDYQRKIDLLNEVLEESY